MSNDRAVPPVPEMDNDTRTAIEEIAGKKKAPAKKKAAVSTPAKPVAKAKPEEAESKKLIAKRYRSKVVPMHHPYQNVLIPVTHAVPLEIDNWVEVQVAAGVIIEEG